MKLSRRTASLIAVVAATLLGAGILLYQHRASRISAPSWIGDQVITSPGQLSYPLKDGNVEILNAFEKDGQITCRIDFTRPPVEKEFAGIVQVSVSSISTSLEKKGAWFCVLDQSGEAYIGHLNEDIFHMTLEGPNKVPPGKAHELYAVVQKQVDGTAAKNRPGNAAAPGP